MIRQFGAHTILIFYAEYHTVYDTHYDTKCYVHYDKKCAVHYETTYEHKYKKECAMCRAVPPKNFQIKCDYKLK